ncbi:MAG: MarR family winged helix-turn-helix transcriptional regulator [Armatimonadota bacterium]
MLRVIGREVRKESSASFPEHQFRALMIIKHNRGASLSILAEHLGTTLPAASKVLEQLVECGYVHRETSPQDRRRLFLSLTQAGESVVESAKLKMHVCLAERLTKLTRHELAVVNVAMNVLREAILKYGCSGTTLEDQEKQQR